MRRTVLLVSAVVMAMAGLAMAQERYEVTVKRESGHPGPIQKIRVSKAAIGSSRIIIWGGASIDPDCSEHPGYTLSVVEPPTHGEVKVVAEPVYMAFPLSNPRAACNARKVPGRQAYYTAVPGFSGHDRVVLEGATEDGTMRHVTIDVDVRKAAG
ncbi:MAG TPA: hypothetical protein VGN89_01840 [Phenylobacterium sp.]|nr:hypothetical protein [Phenylobacterium sp.]